MRKLVSSCGLTLLVSLMGFGSSGCTVVGAGAGAIADQNVRKPVSTEHAATVRPGSSVRLQLKDGSWIRGRFSGLERMPESQYAAEYALAMTSHGGPLPALGRPISVRIRKDGLPVLSKGELMGLDRGCLLLRPEPEAEPECLLFDGIEGIWDAEGREADVERLGRLSAQGDLPRVYRAIRLESDGEVRVVPIEQIDRIGVVSRRFKSAGFLLGLAGDVLLVTFLSNWPA